MRTDRSTVIVTLACFSVCMGRVGFDFLMGKELSQKEEPTAPVVAPPVSLVFDLREHDGGMNFRQDLYFDVNARARRRHSHAEQVDRRSLSSLYAS